MAIPIGNSQFYRNKKRRSLFLYGDIAQLARAPALQAGCQGFESPYLQEIDFTAIIVKAVELIIFK